MLAGDLLLSYYRSVRAGVKSFVKFKTVVTKYGLDPSVWPLTAAGPS